MKKWMAILSLFLLFGAGCNQQKQENTGKIRLVTTTTLLADTATIIGGDEIDVVGLMEPGLDPHLYQASAGDILKMQQADVVLYGGLNLEGKMGEVFEALEDSGKTVICAANGLDETALLQWESDSAVYDPHIWFSVPLWKQEAFYIADQLSEYDPQNAQKYAENTARYAQQLDQLDEYSKGRIQEIPEKQRVLITAHDAFQYFSQEYNIEVKGLQGINTDAEAGTADMRELAQFIATNRIPALFVETSVPPKTIQALQEAVQARGFDVQIGGELYSDSLGDAESGADTYLLMMKANVDTIVDALKGAKNEDN